MVSIDILLEAEVINGGGTWINSGTFQRQTGETANYRAFYSLSSTDIGVFNDVIMTITLDDVYDNINNFISVVLPVGASYTTTQVGTQNILTVNLGSNIPAGQTGYIEFTVQSRTPRGPNGELIPSTLALSGNFLNTITSESEPFSTSKIGPSWEVLAENKYQYEKSVTWNGNIWTPEENAYIVEYYLRRTTSDAALISIGAWATQSATMVDTLPVIPGVTPEILSITPTSYTVVGNQINWNLIYPPAGALIALRYPKEQIDAIGGLAAVGEITNQWDVNITFLGNVEQTVETSVTHEILPIPPKVIGNFVATKYNPLDEPYPANGLYYNDGQLEFRYVLRLSGSNVVPDSFIITEEYLEFTFEDDTTQILTGADFYWNYLTGNAPAGFFEYNTNLDPNFVLYPGISFPSGIHQNFPPSSETEYVNQWRITATGMTRPSNWALTIGTFIVLKQRSMGSQKIKSITNYATGFAILPDGTTMEASMSSTVPFDYDAEIHWGIEEFTIREPILNLGEEVVLDMETFFAVDTSVEVYGSDLYVILPESAVYISSTETADVTPNWNGTGKTLVHFSRPDTVLPLEYASTVSEMTIMISPSAALGEYQIEAYYVINPTQAADPNITMVPRENTAPDIYDFDQNGDTTELVPYQSAAIIVSSSNAVNVLKMSKSFSDHDFEINNDTQVTRGELFQYKFFVRNDSSDDMLYVYIIDIFPYPGDILGSQWAPLLELIPDVPPYVTVFYSQSTTPAMEPIGTGGVDDWTTVPPSDLHVVKALKFEFGDTVFAPGESAEIILTMRSPEDADDLTRAYNSVSYIASARDEAGNITQYLPAFSPPAYAQLTFREFSTSIGDFVWYDLNANGIQDPGEPGINGVLVQLLSEEGDVVYETVTDNHPTSGEPGYYIFEGVWPTTYAAHFPAVLENGYTLTTPHQGTGNNSVADPETGLSNPFTVEDGDVIDNIDAGYISDEPATGFISGYVWLDLNRNGLIDSGEPFVNGVTVNLLDENHNVIATTTTQNNPNTTQPGYYEFGGIYDGSYYVEFPRYITGRDGLTAPHVGSDEEINSNPDPTTGITDAIVITEDDAEHEYINAGYLVSSAMTAAFLVKLVKQI